MQASGHVTVQVLVLGAVFSAIAGERQRVGARSRRRTLLVRTIPRRLELVHGAGGVAIVAVGAALLLTGRRD